MDDERWDEELEGQEDPRDAWLSHQGAVEYVKQLLIKTGIPLEARVQRICRQSDFWFDVVQTNSATHKSGKLLYRGDDPEKPYREVDQTITFSAGIDLNQYATPDGVLDLEIDFNVFIECKHRDGLAVFGFPMEVKPSYAPVFPLMTSIPHTSLLRRVNLPRGLLASTPVCAISLLDKMDSNFRITPAAAKDAAQVSGEKPKKQNTAQTEGHRTTVEDVLRVSAADPKKQDTDEKDTTQTEGHSTTVEDASQASAETPKKQGTKEKGKQQTGGNSTTPRLFDEQLIYNASASLYDAIKSQSRWCLTYQPPGTPDLSHLVETYQSGRAYSPFLSTAELGPWLRAHVSDEDRAAFRVGHERYFNTITHVVTCFIPIVCLDAPLYQVLTTPKGEIKDIQSQPWLLATHRLAGWTGDFHFHLHQPNPEACVLITSDRYLPELLDRLAHWANDVVEAFTHAGNEEDLQWLPIEAAFAQHVYRKKLSFDDLEETSWRI